MDSIPTSSQERNHAEARRQVGRTLAKSTQVLVEGIPSNDHAGTRYGLTRRVVLDMLTTGCEINSAMTVREFYNLISSEGR